MLELKREFNCSFDFKKPFLHLKFSLNLYEFTLQCRRSFGSLYNGVFTWENSHQRKFHIRMTFRFLITFTWWLGHLICLYVDKIHVCSKSQTLRMRYPFQSTNRPISHRSKCSFRVYMIPLRDFVPEWNSRPGATTGVNSRRAGPGDSRRHDILWWYHVNNIEPWEGTGVNSRFGATHVSWKRVFFLFQYLLKLHSNQHQVSVLQRGPYYRGRECMIFWFSGTKRTVRKERLDCIKFVLPNVFVGGLTLKQV